MFSYEHVEMHRSWYVQFNSKKEQRRHSSITRNIACTWQSNSPSYNQPLEEWEEDLNNDEIEQATQYIAN